MDAKRAAGVLRSRRARPCGNDIHYPGNADYEKGQSCGGDCHGGIVVDEASDLGAQALEAWAWQQAREADVEYEPSSRKWHCCGATASNPLAAVLNAMEKEKG